MNTDHDDKNRLIDPEPFGIILGIIGAISAITSTAVAVKVYFPDTPVKDRRKLRDLLNDASKIADSLQSDIIIIQELLERSEITNNRKFHPRSAAFLNNEDFFVYVSVVDNIYNNLRVLFRITNNLDHLLPRMEQSKIEGAASTILEFQDVLDSILDNRDQSIEDALKQLGYIIQSVKNLIATLTNDKGSDE